MKKFKKLLAMCLTVVMAISVMSIGIFATEESETIQFVVTDENGNAVEVIDLVYIPEVADAYEQSKLLRWPATSYYNLSNGAYTMSGDSAAYVFCSKHFNANSSGRLYYSAEVTGTNAYINLYDITNDTYKGTFLLTDQGDGSYMKDGYFSGLSTSSSQYYSYGLNVPLGSNSFTSFYSAISWNEL